MTGQLRVLSLYEGFFAGGARVLHSGVVAGLHLGGGQSHTVLSLHRAMYRETLVQTMENDASYRSLRTAGVPVVALRRRLGGTDRPSRISAADVALAARHAERADVVLSLKEQPLRLVNQVGFPRRPVIVCLHRTDPDNHPAGLAALRDAIGDGRVAAAVCCAASTAEAYRSAGVPERMLHVIPNGIDLTRFRPPAPRERPSLRLSIGVPARASVVAFAARYDAMKNVRLFLAAARAWLARHRGGHVVMCGAGMDPLNTDLTRDIDACFSGARRLLRRLHLLGLYPDMRTVYAAADVVALTSAYGEAAPLCLIEGAACGAVPVATDVGDSARIVAGTGILTAPDPDAIAHAWTEAVDRRVEFMLALAANRARFGHAPMIDAYRSLIERVHREERRRAALIG